MAAEFNLIQHRQEIGPMDAPQKARTGKSDGGTEGLMPFACIMGNAQRTASQDEGEGSSTVPPGRGEAADRSGNDDASGRRGKVAKDPKDILGTGKGTVPARKTGQVAAVKNPVVADGLHRTVLKGEMATETAPPANAPQGEKGARALRSSLQAPEAGRAAKDSQLFTGVSKETGTDRAFPGSVEVLPGKGDGALGAAAREALPQGPSPKEGTTEKIRSLTGGDPKVLNLKVQKIGGATVPHRIETAAAAAPKGEVSPTGRERRVAAPSVKDIGQKGQMAAALTGGGSSEKGAPAEKPRAAEDAPGTLKAALKRATPVQGKVTVSQGGGSGTGGDLRAAETAPGAFRSNLKEAAGAKRRDVAREGGRTQRASSTPTAAGGRNDVGEHPGLRDEMAAAGHEKTGVRKGRDHTVVLPRRETLQSASPVEREVGVGGYQQTALQAASRPAAPTGGAGITPRALIDQVASGAKLSGRVRIALNPPSLGTLDMDVLVRDNNRVHVILQAENNDVRQMLQSHMETLRGSLRSQGLIADTIQVFAQEKTDGNTYGSGQNEMLFGESNNRNRNNREQGGGGDFSDPVSSLPEQETRRVGDDGRISLFA